MADITAQDLLGKTHEELVLLLIHVRRQSAALGEAIDNARNELERSAGDTDASEEARERLRELEEQRTRTKPIISLVDNMVKLGSLYRGPQDAPLSHRIRNVPTSKSGGNRDASPAGSRAPSAMSVRTAAAAAEKSTEEAARGRRADIQVRTDGDQSLLDQFLLINQNVRILSLPLSLSVLSFVLPYNSFG